MASDAKDTKTGSYDFGGLLKDLVKTGVEGYSAKMAADTAKANADQVRFLNNASMPANNGETLVQAPRDNTLLIMGGAALVGVLVLVLVLK